MIFLNINISILYLKYYLSNLLKDGLLHNEGKFLVFLKKRSKNFTTHVGKNFNFENAKVF
jgi:hypothetical protein